MEYSELKPDLEALAALEAQVRNDLEVLDYPKRKWVIPRKTASGQSVLNVLIVGAGQGGTSVGIGLLLEKVDGILLVDKNPAGREGPWKTFARMITLRTPKHLTGPDHGIPSMTFRRWFEAQYGRETWQNVDLIPKELWGDYVFWLRNLFALPVRNETSAGAVRWNDAEQCFEVPLTDKDGNTETVFARKVVLATGIEGSGDWRPPACIADNVPTELYSHTRWDIDFGALRGKKIGVLGAGASAFDNASEALEQGVGEVHLFYRRETLPNVNPYRWAEFAGFLHHHADLDDAQRWRFTLQILRMGQLPPTDTFHRATQHDNFFLHGGSTWDKVSADNGKVQVTTPKDTFEFDYVVAGTGFVTDLTLRKELEDVIQHIAIWDERYTPPEGDESGDLSRHPYLTNEFAFTEKTPGTAPWLRGLINYTFGGLLSNGFGGASISGLKYSLPRVVGGLTAQLYKDDLEAHFHSLETFSLEEYTAPE